mmetsp:Transcript_34015/g.39656  ORF Transcript_34015/g.39656 Transcript_34015/m.39656 type:complete len:264 (+) Transcript_34015:75-866(+)
MTEAAELSPHNALRVIAALQVEAIDVIAEFAPKTLPTAHKLTAAQLSLVPSAHSLVTVLPMPLLARQSTTPLSFQTAAHQELLTNAQLVSALPPRLAVQRFKTAQMANSSALIRAADLSGNTTLSSLNLLKTTAWELRTSAQRPASFAQTTAARRNGLTAKPRTSVQLTLHSNAVMALARLNQQDQMVVLQPSLAMTDLHSSALMVLALVILPSAKSLFHALLMLLSDVLIEAALRISPPARLNPFAQSPPQSSARLVVASLL